MRIAVASLLAAMVVAGCGLFRSAEPGRPRPSKEPLTLALPKWPDGGVHDLASDRGNVVLLDVWATWCEPCKDALPAYEDFVRRFGVRGFRVYAINVDEDRNLVAKYLEESGLSLPILLDENAAVAERVLNVSMMPTSFLIDRRGVVRYVHEGFGPQELAKYEREIETLLAEPGPAK